ncbi:MAG: zinc-dependent metalloprotease [Actinomycetales bacterium]
MSSPNDRSRRLVDWDFAVTTATRLTPAGPSVSATEAHEIVAQLRELAVAAQPHVRDYTGLDAGGGTGSVVVLDRPGWVRANIGGFQALLEPLTEMLLERMQQRSGRRGPLGGLGGLGSWGGGNLGGFGQLSNLGKLGKLADLGQLGDALGGLGSPLGTGSVGPKVTGAETGALLAFLSTKVLGQFELLPPAGATTVATTDGTGSGTSTSTGTSTAHAEGQLGAELSPSGGVLDAYGPPGRLLLVAPNIVQTERELGVDPADFRLWVCLHEETHRVQFTAVPWLRAYVLDAIHAYLREADLDPAVLLRRIREGAGSVIEALRGNDTTSGGVLLDLVQTPRQRELLDQLTAVMSLLEGHADVVMDGVGPDVVPSVATIRERFQKRRGGRGPVDVLIRRALGLEAKMRQYRDGAAFVRGVVERVGHDGFRHVWDSPANLPSREEIDDPGAWVRRVLG